MVHADPALSGDAPSTTDPLDTCAPSDDGASYVDVMHLSPQMHHAIDLLFAGHTATEVASKIGVHRNTIARWRTSHAAFIAAYNRRRAEISEDLNRRVTSLLDTAISNIERHVALTKKRATPEQIRTSLRLVASLARSRRVFAVGPTDPYSVLDQMIRHDRYLSDRNVHTHIDDRTRASYIATYSMRLNDDAPDCQLPAALPGRIPTGQPRKLPEHPLDAERKLVDDATPRPYHRRLKKHA